MQYTRLGDILFDKHLIQPIYMLAVETIKYDILSTINISFNKFRLAIWHINIVTFISAHPH